MVRKVTNGVSIEYCKSWKTIVMGWNGKTIWPVDYCDMGSIKMMGKTIKMMGKTCKTIRLKQPEV